MATNLTNDHNVYILGAGFSRGAGLPLIRDFMNCLRDSYEWLQTNDRNGEAAAVEEVLRFRLGSTSAAYWTSIDLENIEELFSLASADADDLADKTQTAIAAVLDYRARVSPQRFVEFTRKQGLNLDFPKGIAVSLPVTHGGGTRFKCDLYVHHVGKLLGFFSGAKAKGQNTFITFNYDTLIEEALEGLGVPFHYGFEKQSVGHDKSAKAEFAYKSSGIPVLKIHGSVNWARKGSVGGKLTIYGGYCDVARAGLVPELVPPSCSVPKRGGVDWF